MNFNFFASLFNKQTKKLKLKLPDSILIKNLKKLCIDNKFELYENATIFHHNLNITVPLLVLDPNRGIYLFEYKEWSYDELCKHTIEKHTQADSSKDTLAYEKVNNFITIKFNELIHNDGVKIFNFLLAQNLNSNDYEHLESSKQALLPYEKIIFNNSSESKILSKMSNVIEKDSSLPSSDYILANLFTQYLVLNDLNNVCLATKEQIKFIENRSYNIEVLYGHANSGKTTSLLLKAILLKLKEYDAEITIIEPTTISCDILKSKMIDIIEYSIIGIDITSINIITPTEFKSLSKIPKYVLCDDVNLLDDSFLDYLYSKTKNTHLSLVNPKDRDENVFKLTKKFDNKKSDIEFINCDPIPKAIELISIYNSKDEDLSILCISSMLNTTNLDEELKNTIGDKAILLDSSKNLIDQESSLIMLSDYENIDTYKADIAILLDINQTTEDKLAYAINLANKKVYIVYNQESEKTINLKKTYNIIH